MSIRDDARQEAERRADQRFPELVLAPENEQRADDFMDGFEAGAVWASEQADREPSDAEVEAAARSMYRQTNELSMSGAHDLARAALLAAQEERHDT